MFSVLQNYGQNVGINSTGALPNSSAILDVSSQNKGVLIPQVTLTSSTDAITITSPAKSLLVFNTSNSIINGLKGTGFYYNNGTSASPIWVKILNNTDVNIPNGLQNGDMLYWNGTAWSIVPAAAQNGQRLSFCYGVPTWTWGGCDPIVITSLITSITPVTATCGGNVTQDGGNPAIERGLCIDTLPNPTTTNRYPNGSGTGVYSNNFINFFLPNKTYHIRAYVITSLGTFYGANVSFTTLPAQRPVVTTAPSRSITQNSAVLGGDVITDNGSVVTERGICWSSTLSIPTITNNRTPNGGGIGAYAATLNTFIGSQKYFYRAYAINAIGTAYGLVDSVITLPATLPVVVTTPITINYGSNVVVGGDVTNTGGGIIVRGICWSTSPNPTILNNIINAGNAGGAFTASLSPLARNTTYYYRAYATNNSGTAYGAEISFTTPSLAIGDTLQGGKVLALFIPGQPGYVAGQEHGVIVSFTDEVPAADSLIRWFNGTAGLNMRTPWNGSGNSRTIVGSARLNMDDIIFRQGAGTYAASYCDNLVKDGYSDWLLPTLDEVQLMYRRNGLIGNFVTTSSTPTGYWTSTWFTNLNNAAYLIRFQDGLQLTGTTSLRLRIRAVRYF